MNANEPLPVCKLVINHDNMPADRWQVMLYVNKVGFAIGCPCETLAIAQDIRDKLKVALREIVLMSQPSRAVVRRPDLRVYPQEVGSTRAVRTV